MARGVREAGGDPDPCPVADGGEGTIEVLVAALGGELHEAAAHDPLERPIEARFALLGDGRAVVETAAASGLTLVDPDERDAERASSRGTGELILAAAAAGAETVLVGVGGSATTDGGAGAIEAIAASGGIDGVRLEVLCDVTTPFESAAALFGPQKGADAAAVERLTTRLAAFAGTLPRDPRGRPMTGAGGGLSGGLWAAFGARLVPGAAYVLGVVGFDRRLEDAVAVIAGEGRLDPQSVEGKLVGELARRCRDAGVPLHAIAGQVALERPDAERLGLASAREAGSLAAIERAASEIAVSWRA